MNTIETIIGECARMYGKKLALIYKDRQFTFQELDILSNQLGNSLKSLGVGKGDEVLIPTFTFFATAGAVSRLDAVPVFVDIDPHTYNMDPLRIEDRITPRTKAVIPVHLFGQVADMDPIMEIAERHRLVAVEDACQAHGAEYWSNRAGRWLRAGTIGSAGAFSFYPGKNLGAYGEGGMVVTNPAPTISKSDATPICPKAPCPVTSA
jgi:dTDP-4-amino-4,6-dideoxygalactose transaminase